MTKILIVLGTRPEAIKLAPVYKALLKESKFEVVLCSTGQHVEMVQGILQLFGMKPRYEFQLLKQHQTLARAAGQALEKLEDVINESQPDWILCQGDTTTAFCAALAGYYNRVPVGHVEAGLRTYDPREPFPEESNRRLISPLASLHFAPTLAAKQNLVAERIPAESIRVTGNTAVDALRLALKMPETNALRELRCFYEHHVGTRRLILVTGHRREHWGGGLEALCLGLRRALAELPDVAAIFPVHLNPHVHAQIHSTLTGVERVFLLLPQDYREFVWLLDKADLILTDSGGIQEEAPYLGKPVLVFRNKTERSEGVDAGTAKLVGTDPDSIQRTLTELLTCRRKYLKMARATSPYGDGFAAGRIVETLKAVTKEC